MTPVLPLSNFNHYLIFQVALDRLFFRKLTT